MTYVSDMHDGESDMWHDSITTTRRKKKKKKKRHRPWMIHVSRLSNRIDEFSKYERTLVCNPITYRRAETLIIICYVKLGICIRSDWRGNYRSAKRICISFPRRSFPRSVYINVKLFRNRSIRWVVRAIPSDRKSIRRISENVNAMYNSS